MTRATVGQAEDDDWAVAGAAVAVAVVELRTALRSVGVILPSIGLDLPSAVAGSPLVSLGRINVVTAQALTKVLKRVQAEGPLSGRTAATRRLQAD